MLYPSEDLIFEGASYRIQSYTDSIYKVVHFNTPRSIFNFEIDKSRKHEGGPKLDQAISRAKKVVLELGLCNSWKWFCTFTLDKAKYDRSDLDTYFKDFSQWIRDQRKALHIDISYVLVPERHADGNWHVHGLFTDIPDLISFEDLSKMGYNIPWKLVEKGYFNWIRYQRKFGFCSFGLIKDPVSVAFYLVKYITKSFSNDSTRYGKHLYFCSKGLNRSTLHGEVYGEQPLLDSFCVNKYEFCSTGFTTVEDGCTWDFALEYMKCKPLFEPSSFDDIEPDIDFEQLNFGDFYGKN